LRYLNHAKTQLKLIDEKKYKQYGDPNENEKNRHDLKISIKDLRLKPSLLEIFTSELSISKILYGKMPLSADDLLNFKNIWTMYSDLQKVESKIKENKDKGLLQDPLALAHLSYELNKMNGLLYSSYGHGNQRLTELSFESRAIGLNARMGIHIASQSVAEQWKNQLALIVKRKSVVLTIHCYRLIH